MKTQQESNSDSYFGLVSQSFFSTHSVLPQLSLYCRNLCSCKIYSLKIIYYKLQTVNNLEQYWVCSSIREKSIIFSLFRDICSPRYCRGAQDDFTIVTGVILAAVCLEIHSQRFHHVICDNRERHELDDHIMCPRKLDKVPLLAQHVIPQAVMAALRVVNQSKFLNKQLNIFSLKLCFSKRLKHYNTANETFKWTHTMLSLLLLPLPTNRRVRAFESEIVNALDDLALAVMLIALLMAA